VLVVGTAQSMELWKKRKGHWMWVLAQQKKWERHLELELSIESALSERGRAASMQQCRLNNHLPSRGVARTDW
jgi:hypothetical protein